MRTVGAVGALALVLVAAQAAHAALTETPISRFTAADQAAAKAAVLRSADLEPARGIHKDAHALGVELVLAENGLDDLRLEQLRPTSLVLRRDPLIEVVVRHNPMLRGVVPDSH